MPNPLKGETPLKLADGRALTLVADHAAYIKAAQAYTGKTKLKKLMRDIQPLRDADGEVVLDEDGEPEHDTIPATCALFFGMLDAYHPELTLRDATNILVADSDRVSAAISEALVLSHPEIADAEGKQDSHPRQQTPSGKNSGGNGAKSGSTRKRSGGQHPKRSK